MKYSLVKDSMLVNSGYDYGGQSHHNDIWWALCSAPSMTGVINQLTMFIFCRESLGCRMFDRMSTVPSRRSVSGAVSKMPLDKLRLLAKLATGSNNKQAKDQQKKKFESSAKVALKILNIIEREHKWALTTAHIVKPLSDGDTVYMFVASKKWMRSPHLLSLFTLLVRIAQQTKLNDASFKRIRTYKSLLKKLKEYSAVTNHDFDKISIKKTIKYWDPLFRNYLKLYHGMPMKRNFDSSKYDDHYDEGLQKLCCDGASDNETRRRFKEMVEEA